MTTATINWKHVERVTQVTPWTERKRKLEKLTGVAEDKIEKIMSRISKKYWQQIDRIGYVEFNPVEAIVRMLKCEADR